VKKRYGVILFVLLAFGGGTLWLLLSRAPIVEEGRCRLVRRKADPSSQLIGLGRAFLEPALARPEDVKDLPDGFDRPCFYHMDTRAGRLPVVLDSSHGVRLCLDSNHDGLLSDERCFSARSVKGRLWGDRPWRFGPVGMDGRGAYGEQSAVFYALRGAVEGPVPLSVLPVYCRSGRLRVDGTVYKVVVVDGDYDGQFGSVVSLPAGFGAVTNVPPENKWRVPRSDLFAIDKNHDGKFEFSLYGPSEVMPLSKLVALGDKYYAIDVALEGSELRLTESQPVFGRLAVEPADATLQLKLWSDAADQYVSRSAGPWDLPAGTYQTLEALVILQDSNGDSWTFSTLRDLGALSLFRIRPGETTPLRIGPPFVVKADVRQVDSGTVSISPILAGCAGEQYQADFKRNWRRAPERMFKIVDEKGAVLVTDKFQYG
jgi:hypothetical protein